MKYVRIL